MLAEMLSTVTFQKDWADFRAYAIKMHGSQMYGEYPYCYHLALVETLLVERGFGSHDYRAAAWLHDVVEDTHVTVKVISGLYGPTIAALVWACTGEGENRKERAQSIYKKLKTLPEAAIVKVADRIVNVNESLKNHDEGSDNKLEMYLKEWPEFKANVGPLMVGSQKTFALWDSLITLMESSTEAINKKAG